MKIHYHSDCAFFAGCEKMLVNLWTDENLRREHEISFSYRQSPAYTRGLWEHLTPDFPVFPLSLPIQEWPRGRPRGVPSGLWRAARWTFRLLTDLPFFLFEVLVLRRLFREVGLDVVHVNNGGYPGARSARAAVVAARLAGVRHTIMVVNNLASSYRNPGRWLDYPVDRWVTRSVTRWVTGSQAAAKRLRQVLHLEDERVTPIHNGVRLRPATESAQRVRSRFGIPADFKGVLFGVVAVMETRKGHRVLLDAVTRIAREKEDIRDRMKVWIEGDGPLRRDLEDVVRARGLTDVVCFVGKQDNVTSLMNSFEVLVLPSVNYEDFPNVTLEAMGLGKAVIASELAGTPEQVSVGETGLLVVPGDAKSLATALCQLIEQPDLVAAFGERGRTRYNEMFTPAVAVEKYLDLYESLERLGEAKRSLPFGGAAEYRCSRRSHSL